ncbi:hypothetical protein C8R43DRAFT_1234349, partial [Mycena crocata]
MSSILGLHTPQWIEAVNGVVNLENPLVYPAFIQDRYIQHCGSMLAESLSRNGESLVAYPQGHFTRPSKSFSKLVLFKSPGAQISMNATTYAYFARLNLTPAPLSFNLNPGRNYHSSIGSGLRFNSKSSYFDVKSPTYIQLDFSLHQVHQVQHYHATVALRCIIRSQRSKPRVFSSYRFSKSTNTEISSSLIHATQRLRMIVPSVHTFAGFKLLSSSFADDRSIGAYICGLQTLILQNMLNHSLLQFLGLNFVFRAGVGHLSPLRDHRIHNVSSSRERAEPTGTFLSRQNPPEANDALLGLAMHSVRTCN